MHFIIQRNISDYDLNRFIQAIGDKHTYETFYHIPFDTSYPNLDNKEKLFVYAASSVTDQIMIDYEDTLEFKGVFNHTSAININAIYNKTPDMMWTTRINGGDITLEQASKLELTDSVSFFARPEIDDKLFSGQVFQQYDLALTAKKMIDADETLRYRRLFVGLVDQPEYEYRLFVVSGKVVTASKYRVDGFVYPTNGCPNDVKEFAEKFYTRQRLPSACVIDIGTRSIDNKIGVIEVNSINNSGFYDCDLRKLVDSLDEMKIY